MLQKTPSNPDTSPLNKPDRVGMVDKVDNVDTAEKTDRAESGWLAGTCKWFNTNKGWGFITVAEVKEEGRKTDEKGEGKVEGEKSDGKLKSKELKGAENLEGKPDSKTKGEKTTDESQKERTVKEPSGDIFVHQGVIEKDGFRSLQAGEELEFQATRCSRGWEAVRVRGRAGREIQGAQRPQPRQKKVRLNNIHCYLN